MNRRSLFVIVLVLLGGFILLRSAFHWHDIGLVDGGQPRGAPAATELMLPELSDAEYNWIGSRIYRNEALGKAEYLTHWNDGEDFPSLGIGHFIWFPRGGDAPFDEQFPALVSYLRQQVPGDLQMPDWLQDLDPFDAPWADKAQFDAARQSPEMISLRQWLEATQLYQAKFIVSRFEKRWHDLELPGSQKQQLTGLLQQVMEIPAGLFAVIDYYNFKGLGDNARERYQGRGWGLVQVLEALAKLRAADSKCADIVTQFSDAAAGRLRLRVELSPPERNEARWLEGWIKRLDAYVPAKTITTGSSPCGFHITPYLQNPAKDAITLIWFSKENRAGQVTAWKDGSDGAGKAMEFESSPVLAEALFYHPAEKCAKPDCGKESLPYFHQVRLTGLEPGTRYAYRVKQSTGSSQGNFSTLADGEEPLRFIVYGDSETEPESTGKHVVWPSPESPGRMRRYPLDQTTGYARNLDIIQQRQPAFVAIAGDLVQTGGEQRDWDEFWLHNAELAASVVLLPSLGNHDYFGGPGELGKYATADSERAVRKFQTYFDLPSNGASSDEQSERYYAFHHGVISLIVLDVINGLPDRSATDTNWRLLGEGEGGFAPDWQAGSEQYAWLQEELVKAQESDRFTFVMFHHSPYTSGVHGRPPGEKPRGDIFSALPLKALTPILMRHGVDAVFGGHDEMYEHSVVSGTEVSADGIERAHKIHFYDIGIGGDGLRGPLLGVTNPDRVFLADSDSPEVYGEDGVLADGGKHYGHLEVNVEQNSDGVWQARLDAVYAFPILAPDGRLVDVERRLYDDTVTLTAR